MAEVAGFRFWPAFSAAGIRRRLVEAVACGVPRRRKADRRQLSELLKAEESNAEAIECVVRRLQMGCGASEVRRLAKDDGVAREKLARLGAVPLLVGMLDSGEVEVQIEALYALLNLGIGNDRNKSAIVATGAVQKMLNMIESGSRSLEEAMVANFLSLSALDSSKPIIASSGAIPFLVKTFHSSSSSQSKQDALRALLNLSISAINIPQLVNSNLVPALLSALGDMSVSDRILSLLSNLVSTSEGRAAVSQAPKAFPALVDVVGWSDAPACQEAAAYVLMVMSHRARAGDRAAMADAGIASAMLELTLMGTALAQKRASRVLDILRVDKGKQLYGMSAPITGGGGEGFVGLEEEGMSEERMAVRQLVQQSLHSNMRRIVRRANLPQDLHQFRANCTSKSLPLIETSI